MKRFILMVTIVALVTCFFGGCSDKRYKCIDCGKKTFKVYHTTTSLKNGDTVNVMCKDCAREYWVEPFNYKTFVVE